MIEPLPKNMSFDAMAEIEYRNKINELVGAVNNQERGLQSHHDAILKLENGLDRLTEASSFWVKANLPEYKVSSIEPVQDQPKVNSVPDWVADTIKDDYKSELKAKIEAIKTYTEHQNDPYADGYNEGHDEGLDAVIKMLEGV